MIEIKPPENLEKWIYENVKFKDHPVDEIKNAIKAALTQCRLHAPLVWHDLDSMASEASYSKCCYGFIVIVFRHNKGLDVEEYMPVLRDGRFGRQLLVLVSDDYPNTLEAAKQAAQDWVDEQLNAGRETP